MSNRKAPRGAELTPAERLLLDSLRLLGLDVRRGYLKDSHGGVWQHTRKVIKGVASWSHSQR